MLGDGVEDMLSPWCRGVVGWPGKTMCKLVSFAEALWCYLLGKKIRAYTLLLFGSFLEDGEGERR